MSPQRYFRQDPPRLHRPRERHQRIQPSRPERGPPSEAVSSIAKYLFLALTAGICAILALVGTILLYLQETRRLARKTKRKLRAILKDTAVFIAVVLTNIVLEIVTLSNALEPGLEDHSGERVSCSGARTVPSAVQPDHYKLKREEEQRTLVREYSRSLWQSYVLIITALLDEEAERASSKTSRTSARTDSILRSKFDSTDRMMQMASYFADAESYPIDMNALRLAGSKAATEWSVSGSLIGSGKEEDDSEVEFNPWRSDKIPDAI